MSAQDPNSELEYLRRRVAYLDEVNRFTLDAVELAASLGDFQQTINNLENPLIILNETRLRIQRLFRFKATAFYLIEEESNRFYQASIQPECCSEAIEDEFDRLVDEGTFAWGLRNKKAVTVPSKSAEGCLILHVMATTSRIRGMFIGFKDKSEPESPDIALSLLSIILLYSSNALESYELYKMIREVSKSIESRENYRMLFEAAPDGVEVLDASGRIIDCNRAFEMETGCGREQIIGKHTSDFLSTVSRKTYESKCARLKIDGYLEGELELKCGNGAIIPVWRKEKAIYNDKGGFVGSVIYNRDISVQKKAEEEKRKLEARLHRASRMEAIGTLAGGIAHDFNNLLMPILGYAELTLNCPEDHKRENNLRQIIKGAKRAGDLTKQILLFSSQTPQEPKPCIIAPIIKESLALLRATVSTTIGIQTSFFSSSMVLADPTKIHQIMLNICTNAVHAMRDKGGNLSVSLDDVHLNGSEINQFSDLTPGPYLRLTVSDTGHGMHASTLERIFDPFFTTKDVGEGTGMGLSVVHGIVKSHSGAIDVSSMPGEGTTFKIYFPIIESVPQFQDEVQMPDTMGKERVLFVDDDEASADVARDLLESLGYQVAAERSSIKALEIFRHKPENFDLVITDYAMPQMTGNDLAAEVIRIRPEIPVIVCTGSNDKRMQDDAIEKGVSAFVLKPLGIQEFSQTIRKVLQNKPSCASFPGENI